MMNGDVCARLRDCIADYFRGTMQYGYYMDHSGDGESGQVIYCTGGDVMQADYEIGSVGGKATCGIDFEGSVDVVPITSYVPEAEETDHYAAMAESFREAKLYKTLPIYERYISQKTRKAAGAGDFAGKGKSFPILKAEDVSAALHSIGRAGPDNYSADTIRANIKRIAKAKGFALPDSLKDDAKESLGSAGSHLRSGAPLSGTHSGGPRATGQVLGREGSGEQQESTSLKLTESAATLETIVLKEARADYETKLIAPGKGSSAFYPKEVLQRDGPKVFKAGTHVYLNHPTAAEEAARPEGNVANLAGVLTTDAVYHENHAKGPGLYARMKVFADHAQIVEEKAAHVGMSIRASGVAESGKSRDGLPILKELTSAESVDVVTRAGAGGMILTEAARGAAENSQEVDMTKEEITALVESAVKTAVAAVTQPVQRLTERELRADATVLATRVLSTCTLHEASKQRVIEAAVKTLPKTTDGMLDEAKFAELVTAEAKREGQYVAALTGTGTGVRGMGPGGNVVEMDPAKLREAQVAEEAAEKRFRESENEVFCELMGNPAAAKFAVEGKKHRRVA